MPKHKTWFWVAALAAACFFDFLFWQKPFGISFCIWTASLLLFGYVLAWREGKKPAAASIIISILTLGFSFVPAWRVEPLTRIVSVLLTLGGMLLLSATFQNGNWPFYRMWDFFKNLFVAIGAGLSRAIMLGSKPATPPSLDGAQTKSKSKKPMAIVRGVLIALPVVALFAVLLSAADPIFSDWLTKLFNLEKLPEYLFRLFYILMIGCFLVGVYLHAIQPLKEEARPDPNQAWAKPFLGWTETAIILGAVDLLFLAFVFIQFRYLFGGAANISETGYTFSEYARKGFGELVAVAIISLGLYLLLHTITKRESKGSQVAFSTLTLLLMANVLVILASSLQRLLLYEDAYGFSQLRTYTHIFIFCLAGLILVTMLLEVFRRQGHFALAFLVTIIGFGATLAVINVNGFITGMNVARAVAGKELDVPHLVSLSSDAIPELFEKYNDVTTPASVKDNLGYALACQKALLEDPSTLPWQGFNLSNSRAWSLFEQNKAALSKFKVTQNNALGWYYEKNDEQIPCVGYFMD
jgi:hypothetical protein